MCSCSLSYPACSAHAPFCHLWPVRLYKIFPYYVTNGTNFYKTSLNPKSVFWVSLQLFPKIFLFLRINEQDLTINVPDLRVRHSFSLSVFNENPSSGSRLVPFGQKDRQTWHDRYDSRFSQFCEKLPKRLRNVTTSRDNKIIQTLHCSCSFASVLQHRHFCLRKEFWTTG